MLCPMMRRRATTSADIARFLAVLCLCCLPLSAQIDDTSGVMDKRMRVIAGENALDCGRVRVGVNAEPALRCARKSIKRKQPFVVRFDDYGIDSFLSDGFAEDGLGNVYHIEFDSLGWGPPSEDGGEVLDDKHDFVEGCTKPARIHKDVSRKGTFMGYSCVRSRRTED